MQRKKAAEVYSSPYSVSLYPSADATQNGRLNTMKRKETQNAVVRSCFLFIRSGQNHLARHSERGKKTRQTEEEVGRQHQGMDRPGVRKVPEGSAKLGKMEKTGCKIICGAPTTLAIKGLMMMMKHNGYFLQRRASPLQIPYTQSHHPPTFYHSHHFSYSRQDPLWTTPQCIGGWVLYELSPPPASQY